MDSLEGRDSFNNIRRSVKISYFVASIIPLSLLVYFSVKYVYPYVSAGDISNTPVNIVIVLVLAVFMSILGLILTTKATNSSIKSAQELNTKLKSLFEITKQFRETLHLDILLKKIMESAMDLTSAESGSLLLYDEQGNLKFQVNTGMSSRTMNNRILKPGEGIASWVAENGTPLIINDVSKDKRFNLEFDNETGFKTSSVMCVPLINSNEIIGVIELRNKKQGFFTKQDEALLHSLADQASISIAQNRSNERQHSDFIHITEILVGTQDYMENKKGHGRRVANYANLTGKQLNFSDIALRKLYYACLFHDIGMLKIDITERGEKQKVLHHPRLGYDLIKPVSLWSDSADIILYHHERYDGAGYPAAKKKDEIPLGSRILFVADTFDVLTDKNSYRKPLDFKAAIAELDANSGTQFDPMVVDAFKAAIAEAGIINK